MRARSLYVPCHVGITRHPKFRQLRDELAMSTGEALGLLMMLLLAVKEVSDDGCLAQWRAVDIADAVEWDREPADLIDALVTTGWLDRGEDGTLCVHEADVYARKPARATDGAERTGPLSGTERSQRSRAKRKQAAAPDATECNDRCNDVQRPMQRSATATATATTAERREGMQRVAVVAPSVAPQRDPPTPFDEPLTRPPRAAPFRSRGVMGLEEQQRKPQAEAAIREALHGRGPHADLAELLRGFGAGAADKLEGLLADWARNYDERGPASALAKLRGWLRDDLARHKANTLNVAAAEGRAAKAGVHVPTVTTSAPGGIDKDRARARTDYEALTAMGVRPGQRFTEYWAEHEQHYRSGGRSRWELHMEKLNGGEFDVPDETTTEATA